MITKRYVQRPCIFIRVTLLSFTVATCRSRLRSLFMEKALYAQVWMLDSTLLYVILQGPVYNALKPPNLALKVNVKERSIILTST